MAGMMARRFSIHRFTLEARSPLMISGGADDPLLDVVLARDVNGLPMVPATGITGALRFRLGKDRADELLGFQKGESGQRSSLTLTDALYHLKNDRPRDGLVLDRTVFDDDEIAQIGLEDSPIMRDHAKLNDRGVVDGDGKFTRSAVPRGARFTFEISHWGDAAALEEVAQVIRSGFFLGGATRSGYGHMACIAEGIASLDLVEDREGYLALATADLGTSPIKMTPCGSNGRVGKFWTLAGRIEGPLLIGGRPLDQRDDRAPYSEHYLDWSGDEGTVAGPATVLPASAIKGPLRHRTYYYLKMTHPETAGDLSDTMFGSAASEDGGRAGKLRFFDFLLPDCEKLRLTHVSLDRFTGGARKGALFTDLVLWQPELRIEIQELDTLDAVERGAFRQALSDLQSGCLGIGAEWSEGAGILDRGSQLVEPESEHGLT